MHGDNISPVAIDALVLKHQAINIYNTDLILIVLNQINRKMSQF